MIQFACIERSAPGIATLVGPGFRYPGRPDAELTAVASKNGVGCFAIFRIPPMTFRAVPIHNSNRVSRIRDLHGLVNHPEPIDLVVFSIDGIGEAAVRRAVSMVTERENTQHETFSAPDRP